MVFPPVQDDRFYTITCWAQGKKNSHCERTGSFGVSILDNGFISKRMLTKDWASNSNFAQG